MFTGKQLAAYCEQIFRAKWVYWYGTYGNKCTEKLYKSKKKQYPSHYGSSRTSGYMKDIENGKTCADCVGMIKSFFWTGGEFGATPKYNSNKCPDTSANGMFKLCKETGPIGSIPDIPGLAVWKDGHIGVYVGGGYTVEMKGFNYDCKRNKVKDGPWKKWGKLPASMICYDDTPEPGPEPTPEPAAQMVEITGNSVNVRSAPGTVDTRVLGVAHKGDRLPWQGLTAESGGRDWYLVEYRARDGWVSSRYGRLAE